MNPLEEIEYRGLTKQEAEVLLKRDGYTNYMFVEQGKYPPTKTLQVVRPPLMYLWLNENRKVIRISE